MAQDYENDETAFKEYEEVLKDRGYDRLFSTKHVGGSALIYRAEKKTDKGVTEEYIVKVGKKSMLDKATEKSALLADNIAKKYRFSKFMIRQAESFYHQNHHCSVWEKANGGTLRDKLEQRTEVFSRTEACRFLSTVAQGLDVMHGNADKHADIKPENLFVQDGILILGDIGLAGEDGGTQTTSFLGTLQYMLPHWFVNQSPERSFGRGSKERDRYAFAVCYAEMRLGRHPFQKNKDSAHELGQNKATDLYFLDGLEKDEREIIDKVLKCEFPDSLVEWLASLEPRKIETKVEYVDRPNMSNQDEQSRLKPILKFGSSWRWPRLICVVGYLLASVFLFSSGLLALCTLETHWLGPEKWWPLAATAVGAVMFWLYSSFDHVVGSRLIETGGTEAIVMFCLCGLLFAYFSLSYNQQLSRDHPPEPISETPIVIKTGKQSQVKNQVDVYPPEGDDFFDIAVSKEGDAVIALGKSCMYSFDCETGEEIGREYLGRDFVSLSYQLKTDTTRFRFKQGSMVGNQVMLQPRVENTRPFDYDYTSSSFSVPPAFQVIKDRRFNDCRFVAYSRTNFVTEQSRRFQVYDRATADWICGFEVHDSYRAGGLEVSEDGSTGVLLIFEDELSDREQLDDHQWKAKCKRTYFMAVFDLRTGEEARTILSTQVGIAEDMKDEHGVRRVKIVQHGGYHDPFYSFKPEEANGLVPSVEEDVECSISKDGTLFAIPLMTAVVVLNTQDGNVRKTLSDAEGARFTYSPASRFSSDKTLLACHYKGGGIYVLDLESGNMAAAIRIEKGYNVGDVYFAGNHNEYLVGLQDYRVTPFERGYEKFSIVKWFEPPSAELFGPRLSPIVD